MINYNKLSDAIKALVPQPAPGTQWSIEDCMGEYIYALAESLRGAATMADYAADILAAGYSIRAADEPVPDLVPTCETIFKWISEGKFRKMVDGDYDAFNGASPLARIYDDNPNLTLILDFQDGMVVQMYNGDDWWTADMAANTVSKN